MKGFRRKKARKGQGMTEYIIIVALIAIAAIGVITLFGDNIRALFGAAADATAGKQNVTSQVKETPKALLKSKTLKTFNKGNSPTGN
jgi:Flp pilus assembly pilin Flp